jgi:hypothetical protein
VQQSSENIFQIWDRLGRKTPFLVKNENWPTEDFVLVERVDCNTLVHGKAFGFPVRGGKPSDLYHHDLDWKKEKTIPLAHESTWIIVIANFDDLMQQDSGIDIL